MKSINDLVGIGLKSTHFNDIILLKPDIGWFEIHSENYFYHGEPSFKYLMQIKENYPISLHGVGLSLGGPGPLDRHHLQNIMKLIQTINPFLISEHLSWSRINDIYLPDLLPVSYTKKAQEIFINNITSAQDYLQTQLLIENPSSYFEYADSAISEVEFLVEVAQRSGAKILLDINNIHVSSINHSWDSYRYIDFIPKSLVGEFHLAGHSTKVIDTNNIHKVLKIDTHDRCVSEDVWKLYDYAINKFGPHPTLIEWDVDIPPLETLLLEVNKAKLYLNKYVLPATHVVA